VYPDNVEIKMQAYESRGAHGLMYVFFCEQCWNTADTFKTGLETAEKDYIEKFIEEHCYIKECYV
jgi:hypothetical protein